MKKPVVALILGAILMGCNPAQQAEKQIRAAYADMDKAMAAKDAAKATEGLAPGAALLDKNNKPINASQVQNGLQMLFKASSSVQSTTTVTSFAMEGKGAVVGTKSTVSMVNLAGTLAMNTTSRDYWEPVDGAWKIKRSRSLSENVTLNGKPVPTR
jgi:ketosteroid isomerase-like protein